MMMVRGPVQSPYPGKYVMFVFVAFLAFMTWRFSKSAVEARRDQRCNNEQGVTVKPDSKKSMGAAIVAALVAFSMLVTALAAIYKAWPR